MPDELNSNSKLKCKQPHNAEIWEDHVMRFVAQETNFNRARPANSTLISALILPLVLARIFSAKPIKIPCYKKCSEACANGSRRRPYVTASRREPAKEVYSFQKLVGTLPLALDGPFGGSFDFGIRNLHGDDLVASGEEAVEDLRVELR